MMPGSLLKPLDRLPGMTWLEMGHGNEGRFMLRRADGTVLRVIACPGGGWDHVSVSTMTRTPTWEEMEFIKRLVFRDIATAMQLHVRPDDHVNCHPHTLHLWRPHGTPIPLPPREMV